MDFGYSVSSPVPIATKSIYLLRTKKQQRALMACWCFSLTVVTMSSLSKRCEGFRNVRRTHNICSKNYPQTILRPIRVMSASDNQKKFSPPTKISKKKTKQNTLADTRYNRSMLDHALLSKQEELDLAVKIQRAKQLQADLDVLLEARIQTMESSLEYAMEPQRVVRDFSDDHFMVRPTYDLNEDGEYDSNGYDEHPFISIDSFDEKAQDINGILFSKDLLLKKFEEKSLLQGYLDTDSMDLGLGSYYSGTMYSPDEINDELAQELGIATAKNLRAILSEGSQARDVLIRSNLKLVFSIAKKWSRNHGGHYNGSWTRPSLNEAVQEGCLGLIQAVERFDPNRGLRFATYATYYITNLIRLCFQKTSTGVLRVPIQYYETRTRFQRLVKEYYEKEGAKPSLDALAAELNVAERRLRMILRLTQPLLSTDGPRPNMFTNEKGGLDTTCMSDFLVEQTEISEEDRIELSLLRQSLEDVMEIELIPLERDILRLRLGLDDGITRTFEEVAHACGGRLSVAEIKSTEGRALRKLRSPDTVATYQLMAYFDFVGIDRGTIKM